MAPDSNTYSRISVSDEDEDDVVIQAGIPVAGDEPQQEDSAGEESGAGQPVSDGGASLEDAQDTDAKPHKPAKRNSDYHPTTVEDLEESSMSAMQKVIIAVAVVAVVAFAVYYGFLR